MHPGTDRPIKLGDTITEEQADSYYDAHLDHVVGKLNKNEGYRDAPANIKAGLTSFGFNLGENFLKPTTSGFETIQRHVNDRNWQGVKDALPMYRNPGSSAEAGLLRRRNAEIELMNTPIPARSAAPGQFTISPGMRAPGYSR